MVKAARRKRASEDDLYRGCIAGQYCPEDIKNKYEQNTIADRILKWVSSFLYFGGLGIGTGRGSGGAGGYTRLGGVTTGRGTNVAKPNVLVESLAPTLTPIDAANPDSSIVPLLEISPGSTIPGSESGGGQIEVVAEVHPPPIDNGPPVIVGEADEPPVLEVTTDHHPTARTNVSISRHANPSYDSNAFVSSTELPGETSVTDSVYIHHGIFGTTIGGETGEFEEIPLLEFTPATTEPRTSTPSSSIRNVIDRFQRRLYNRRLTQQVRVTNRRFLTQPAQLIQWSFENPAFDADVSLLFEQDIDALAAAPEPDFQDIVTLSRPVIAERDGYVRYSRLGQRATIRTRSGTAIGGQVHYYYDLSSISPHEDIEMQTLGELSGDATVVQALADGNTVTSFSDPSIAVLYGPAEDVPLLPDYGEEDILDDYNENFSTSRLEISSGTRSSRIVAVPDGIPPGSVKVFLDNYGVISHRPSNTRLPDYINPSVDPAIILDFTDGLATFYLHPSLFKKWRRKRPPL